MTFTLLFFVLCSVAQTSDKYDKMVDSLTRTGQTEKIIPWLQKEFKANPKSEDVLRMLGYMYLEKNQPDSGEKYYRKAVAVNPACARCYLNLGRAYGMRKDDKKALEYFNKAIELDPGDALFYSVRAKLKETTGSIAGVLTDHNKAIQLDPKNAAYYIERGDYHSRQQSFSFALFDLNEAVELQPNHYYPYWKRAGVYYNKQMIKETLDDINKAIQLDSSLDFLYAGRADVYAAVKEHEKAVADYTRAIQMNPKEYVSLYNRAMQKYALEDMDGACADMQECHALLKKQDPGNSAITALQSSLNSTCDSTKAAYYYQRGIAFYNLKQFEKAVTVYTAGLHKFPGNSMSLSFRGNAYLALKEYAKALTDYDASIKNKDNLLADLKLNQHRSEITDESMGAYINTFIAGMQASMAQSHFALGRYPEALTEINKSIALAPALEQLPASFNYHVRGNIWIALGKYQQALDDFEKMIQLDPSQPFAYVERAVAKANVGTEEKMKTWSIRAGINNQPFHVNWTLPVKTTVKKSDANLLAALADCDKAIALDPKLDAAWYIRGQIKSRLNYEGYCLDLLQAKQLGYPVEPELLKGCGR